jgi:hypothetical protein
VTWHDTTFWAWVFSLGEWTIRVIMLATVPVRRTPAVAKGWLLLIFFEPWIGLVLYLQIGRATLPRPRIEQISRLPQVMSKVLERLADHPTKGRASMRGPSGSEWFLTRGFSITSSFCAHVRPLRRMSAVP